MKKKTYRITNIHIQNYLGEHNIWPVREDEAGNAAFYRRTPQFAEVLESYYIEFYYFPNKH